jgi:hypothetical protein
MWKSLRAFTGEGCEESSTRCEMLDLDILRRHPHEGEAPCAPRNAHELRSSVYGDERDLARLQRLRAFEDENVAAQDAFLRHRIVLHAVDERDRRTRGEELCEVNRIGIEVVGGAGERHEAVGESALTMGCGRSPRNPRSRSWDALVPPPRP